MRRRELAAGIRKRDARRSVTIVAVVIAALVLLLVIWLALQTLGGHSTKS